LVVDNFDNPEDYLSYFSFIIKDYTL